MKNIAIMGLGNIAGRVAMGINASDKACLYAAASRQTKKAEIFAKKYGAKMYYGSYEEMLKDSKVDIVYICTPNEFHYRQIELCLRFGKHVICEKPMVKDEKQVRALFAMAREKGCFLMEAEKTMFTPLNKKIKKMIEEGEIGRLHTIKAEYCSEGLNGLATDHWVFDGGMGGCAYDIGVYPVCASHFFANAKIKEFQVERIRKIGYNCDFGMDADIFYENGVYGSVKCNWYYQAANKGKAVLVGDRGYIEIPAFWKGKQAYLHRDGEIIKIEVSMDSDFEGEISHAAECVENSLLESPILGEEMSVKIIRIISALKEQEEENGLV